MKVAVTYLSALKVDTLVCGGVSGSADEAVEALLAGKLEYDPDVRCDHHDHENHGEGHHCGEDMHGCAGNGGG